MSTHRRHLPIAPDAALAAVDEAARMWGAEWRASRSGGDLTLPVVQGLRRGLLRGSVRVADADGGCSLEVSVEDAELSLNRAAVAILVLGGLGGVSLVFWPVWPALLGFAPIGAVLAILAWLMVVSRLRHSGMEDFIDLVGGLAESL